MPTSNFTVLLTVTETATGRLLLNNVSVTLQGDPNNVFNMSEQLDVLKLIITQEAEFCSVPLDAITTTFIVVGVG